MSRFVWGLILLVVGCGGATAEPPTVLPVPTLSQEMESPTPRTTETRELQGNEALLRLYPLRLGASWVYRGELYDTLPNDLLPEREGREMTATVRVTDTVEEVQEFGEYYAARVVREQVIEASSIDLELQGEYRELFLQGNAPHQEWLILAKDRIYSQLETLDPANVEDGRLEYIFPLEEGEGWYPDGEQRAEFGQDERDIPGYRMVLPLELAERYADGQGKCFEMRERYNPGDTIEYFCEGVGVVGEHFDHAGTPFGNHSILEEFVPAK